MIEARLILANADVLKDFGARTYDGRWIEAEWGPVKDYALLEGDGVTVPVYVPAFSAIDDGMIVVPRSTVKSGVDPWMFYSCILITAVAAFAIGYGMP